jgi:hypothetical protein
MLRLFYKLDSYLRWVHMYYIDGAINPLILSKLAGCVCFGLIIGQYYVSKDRE